MRPRTVCLTVVVCAATVLSALAQTAPPAQPNFSGVWVMDATRSEAAMQDQPASASVAITHTGSTLRIETIRDGKKETATYPIEAPPLDTAEVRAVHRAFWNGAMLVDEGSVDINGRTIGYREARSLGIGGNEMTVETTLKVEHGYEVKGAQTVVSGKNVYVRRR